MVDLSIFLALWIRAGGNGFEASIIIHILILLSNTEPFTIRYLKELNDIYFVPKVWKTLEPNHCIVHNIKHPTIIYHAACLGKLFFGGQEEPEAPVECETREVSDWLVVNMPDQIEDSVDLEDEGQVNEEMDLDEDDILMSLSALLTPEDSFEPIDCIEFIRDLFESIEPIESAELSAKNIATIQPAECIEIAESIQPVECIKIAESIQPAECIEIAKSIQPANYIKPVKCTKLFTKSLLPAHSVKKYTKPDESTQLSKCKFPESIQHTKSNKHAESIVPVKCIKSEQSAKCIAPDGFVRHIKIINHTKFIKPTENIQPVKCIKSAESNQSAKCIKPAEDILPVKCLKSAKCVKTY
ncbi:hypothetical protein CEXT_550151 [Caerostris extrusa]|uniref:Uncharacterized protein n=1 Tax=Caerostris extrusa TaxID=172846 RepID=A0AAV4XMD2_CAEEX|nr:hypothetical protein CEXT_550151 [Caerostris extrusa]